MSSNNRKEAVSDVNRVMQSFKGAVMRQEGYSVNSERPDDVKYEVAKDLGVPLKSEGSNGELTTESAGKIGGKIGGSMVREMIRIAQQRLADREQP